MSQSASTRTYADLLASVLAYAKSEKRIRAALLSGSRADVGAQAEPFQDLDVALYIHDQPSFTADPLWLDRFGERLIMQSNPSGDPEAPFFYLLQFVDGLRLDLKLVEADLHDKYPPESQSVVLLDKDGLFSHLPPASDRDFWPTVPTQQQFFRCCNEFFWLAPYVAKGLWRGQLAYAKFHLDTLMRGELMRLLDWAYGFRTGFSKSSGKFGKHWGGVLPEGWLTRLLDTYAGADEAENWEALYTMLGLFDLVAKDVAAVAGLNYAEAEAQAVTAYVAQIQLTQKSDSE